jgi:hypothetical protein
MSALDLLSQNDMLIRISIYSFAVLLCTGCATTEKIDAGGSKGIRAGTVCIANDDSTKIADFNAIVLSNVSKLGFATRSIGDPDDVRAGCPLILVHNAERSWDGVFYLSFASFRLLRNGVLVRWANYDGANGMTFEKYESTNSKVHRVLEKLFEDVSPN